MLNTIYKKNEIKHHPVAIQAVFAATHFVYIGQAHVPALQ